MSDLNIVRALLKAFRPADEREADSLRRINELVATASAPFSRDHFYPGHLTGSAIVLDRARQHALLLFHGKLQRWLQPGGHFEPGETDPSVSAAREVLEETGLDAVSPDGRPILLDVDVHEIPARKSDPAHFHFDLRMLMIADGAPKDGDGVSNVRWVSPSEFPRLDLDPGLQRALRKTGLPGLG